MRKWSSEKPQGLKLGPLDLLQALRITEIKGEIEAEDPLPFMRSNSCDEVIDIKRKGTTAVMK